MIQKSNSLEYEPSLEPLRISGKQLLVFRVGSSTQNTTVKRLAWTSRGVIWALPRLHAKS